MRRKSKGPTRHRTAFDGLLLLPDGRGAVGDVEQLIRFVHRVGDRGEFHVRVAVDAPGANATAVDITITRCDNGSE
ncbi:hypothetical protein ABZ721_31465 [Streptomyces sp. NPDC006733]|uniref:hypothetical protein n=1 Tax=Streptomyces sp. NPDC006733 TaxID=3155460 RepID=UPI00340A3816